MLTITQEAKEFILDKNTPFYIDVPPEIGCCFHVVDTPVLRPGEPKNPDSFDKVTFDAAVVFVPRKFPDHELTVSITRFLGRKKLVLEGWHLA
jgi:hypothetical protein